MSASATEVLEQSLDPAPLNGIEWPQGDLWSDEPPLETYQHLQQMMLLLKCLDWLWKDRSDYFSAGNLTIYYSARQSKSEDFRGPDFFVVLGTQKYPRKSWAVWEENGQYPNLIIELLSDSTAKTDQGLKKQIYQDIFRTPDYFWFDPHHYEFKGFHLVDGQYEDLQPNEQGHLWSQQLGLFLGAYEQTLRFFGADGQLVPTPEETAECAQREVESAQREVESAQREVEAERHRNKKLTAQLRALGIEPDSES
jgi:Uma2 family endonuclease